MKWSWTIGRIAGIKIQMHWTFLLLLIWVGYIYSAGGSDWRAGLEGIGFILALFGCVVLHEAGHALMARRYGVTTEDITLLPIGGVARMQRIPSDPWAEFWIAIAGPAVNVVIAGFLFVVLTAIHGVNLLTTTADLRGAFFLSLMWVNVLLVLFNLLPAFPMDGGRVLRAVLAMRMDYVQATNVAASIGQGMAILFGITGLFFNPFLIFIALFVYMGAEAEAQNVRFRGLLGDASARDAMMTRFSVLSPTDTLQTAIDELLAGSQQDFPVVEEGQFRGILRRKDLVQALREQSADSGIEGTYQMVNRHVTEQTPLQDALELMREMDCQTMPVFDDSKLTGIITMENVAELMMVRTAGRQFHPDGTMSPSAPTSI